MALSSFWMTGWNDFFHLSRGFWNTIIHGNDGNVELFGIHQNNRGLMLQCYNNNNINEGNDCQRTMFQLWDSKHKLGPDVAVIVIQFVMVLTISWTFRWFLIRPLARYLLGPKRSTSLRLEKFSQIAILALFHTLSGSFAIRIIWGEPWIWPSSQWWIMMPSYDASSNNQIELMMKMMIMSTTNRSVAFKFYYLLYAARYVSDLVSIPFEPTRSDTLAFAIHHIVTIILVLVSAHWGWLRIGAINMLIFDFADPFLCVAKLFKYTSTNQHDYCSVVANRLFEIFAIVFFLTRIVMFSGYIVWSMFTEWHDDDNSNFCTLMKIVLVILSLLQWFWFVMIIKAALIQLQNDGTVEDFRSDDEEDDDPNKKLIAHKKKVA